MEFDVAQILGHLDRNLVHVKFLDSRGRRRQKDTPVTDVRGIVEIVMDPHVSGLPSVVKLKGICSHQIPRTVGLKGIATLNPLEQ